jgi:hypothetical protein
MSTNRTHQQIGDALLLAVGPVALLALLALAATGCEADARIGSQPTGTGQKSVLASRVEIGPAQPAVPCAPELESIALAEMSKRLHFLYGCGGDFPPEDIRRARQRIAGIRRWALKQEPCLATAYLGWCEDYDRSVDGCEEEIREAPQREKRWAAETRRRAAEEQKATAYKLRHRVPDPPR